MALRKILVLRFSAMGDVVLLVPAIRSLIAAHKDVEVTVVTRPKFASFFTDMERVIAFPADVDYTYNGVFGMRELFQKLLRRAHYDVVIDMHDHLRTIILRTMFRMFFIPVIVFDKGRSQKKLFSRKENKDTTPLPHTVDRYRKAFEKAGFPFEMIPGPYLTVKEVTRNETTDWLSAKNLEKNESWIGIAPFAMHKSKIWPVENYGKVITLLTEKMNVKFFLFGGGDKEVRFFNALQTQFPKHCYTVAGQLKIKQELALMEKLDLMLCVDSSNMHLSALVNVPLLSVWGGTHPDVGFAPYTSRKESVLQISRDELPCRPCSVYGRETCYRGDFACLNRITPEQVTEQILKLLAVPK